MRQSRKKPRCWASYKFSIVQRRARSVGCDTSLTLGCPLSSLCECNFHLMVPEQMNATKQEMQNARRGLSAFTGCNLRQFPTTMSHDFDDTSIDPKLLFKAQKNMADVEKRSWPLLGWRSIPGEAFVVQGPDRCPKPPATETKEEFLSWGRRAHTKEIIAEVCLCPPNRDNVEGQCSHTQLVCETISLAQAIANLRRGGADLFDVYVKQFPQLKNYVEPIPGTAIATDQVPQQNWARMLPVIASNLQNGLDIDLNVPAKANDEF
ncbi:hypothetical protein BCR37DRAFT_380647 [Protomyces lactucae-debilis]|uniref:Uncharacterized protein n=1 Tax=Protomyces lactucae-debilis TaxID=2754530 RepID=A0A1Y2FB34_PROLT|nr:uncharacterized protein BCR37DRAFT_380647 [Protomyces lactucae-debilis]ORY80837.1 hypothetical protein BCR37DRAFT_380647 [Protomyces lactucae-debilis]